MYLVVDADVDGKAELVAQHDVSGNVTMETYYYERLWRVPCRRC